MSYIDLPLKFVKAGTMTYAYREAGPTNQRPLVMLHHLSATLDNWDPALIDALSPKVHLLLLDNAGVGASSGQVPPTLQGAARHVVKFIQALDLEEIDLLGISMGGMIAQEVAALIPERIKHLILAGTGPRGREGDRPGNPGNQQVYGQGPLDRQKCQRIPILYQNAPGQAGG